MSLFHFSFRLRLLPFIMLIAAGFGRVQSQQWTTQPSGVPTSLHGVCMATRWSGWCVGDQGVILKTADGGRSWSQQTSGTTVKLRSVFFSDSIKGWAAGDSGTVLATANGGTTWTRQVTGTTQPLHTIFFSSPTTGWVGGANYTILRTNNGGVLWQPMSNVTAPTVTDLHFQTPVAGWAVGTTANPGTGALMKNVNLASEWIPQTNTAAPIGTNFYAVWFTGADTGWIAGAKGIIRTTRDRGATPWRSANSGTGFDLWSLCFTAPANGWAVGDRGTVIRYNGTGWNAEYSSTPHNLYSISFFNDTVGVAVGDSGAIIRYQRYVAPQPLTLFGPDGGQVWDVGSQRAITWGSKGVADLRIEFSTDGGVKWSTLVGNTPAAAGSYAWVVPNTPSTECRIRISDVANPANADSSNGNFSIIDRAVGRDFAVMASATTSSNPPSITLVWPADPLATGFSVAVRTNPAEPWRNVAQLPGTAATWRHTPVELGKQYEYRILKTTPLLNGYGYLAAGIELPIVEKRGGILVIVEKNLAPQLAPQLQQFRADLVGDGWQVATTLQPADLPPAAMRDTIIARYRADSANLKAVLFVGDFLPAYSGDFAPDGVAERIGAQPADVYFGEMNGRWTDSIVYDAKGNGVQTPNITGDGKFDQSELPSDVELQVGRLWLGNLPALNETEAALLKRYFDANHQFRTGAAGRVPERGYIETSFDNIQPEVSANAFRNIGALFGSGGVKSGRNWEYLRELQDSAYLFSYAGGRGSDTVIGINRLTSSLWASQPFRSTFTLLYGNNFYDWKRAQNTLLRMPLGGAIPSLAVCWAGNAPNWFFHQMGTGGTIGESVRQTQNNSQGYIPGNQLYARGVHIALMGDPTLRLHVVKSAVGFSVSTPPSRPLVRLEWGLPDDSVQGWHIYRAASIDSPFTRLTQSPIATSIFHDLAAPDGNNVYLVRPVRLQQSGGGTYWNLGTGILDSVKVATPQLSVGPALLSPENDSAGVPTTRKLYWNDLSGAAWYRVQLSSAQDFSATLIDADSVTAPQFGYSGLQTNSKYYWRVMGNNRLGPSQWSPTWSFTTGEIATSVSPEPEYQAQVAAWSSGGELLVESRLRTPSRVTLELWDMLGRKVATPIAGQHREANLYRDRWPTAGLPSGNYMVVVRSSGGEIIGRAVVTVVGR